MFPEPVFFSIPAALHIESEQDNLLSAEMECQVDGLIATIRTVMYEPGSQGKARGVYSFDMTQAVFTGGNIGLCPFLPGEFRASSVVSPPFQIAGVKNIGPRGEPVAIVDGYHQSFATDIIYIRLCQARPACENYSFTLPCLPFWKRQRIPASWKH